jgi:hypothetical protein
MMALLRAKRKAAARRARKSTFRRRDQNLSRWEVAANGQRGLNRQDLRALFSNCAPEIWDVVDRPNKLALVIPDGGRHRRETSSRLARVALSIETIGQDNLQSRR